MREHQPVHISTHNGMFDRGNIEQVPQDHAYEMLNMKFVGDYPATRNGFSQVNSLIGNVRRMAEFIRPGDKRIIYLDDAGQLFDETNSNVTPIITIAGMVDFSSVQFFGRFYFSPHNREEGLPAEFVYVYDGVDVRKAGGTPPTGTLTVVEGANSGNVEIGKRLFAVVFQTSSGFITAPGPGIFPEVTSTGGKVLDFTAIPTGPAGTIARILLATSALPSTYDGNQNLPTLFFIPGGTITDNTTTELLNVSFFDSELISSANFLKDNLQEIPSCLVLSSYNDRMVCANFDGDNDLSRVSYPGDPETFSGSEGFQVVDRSTPTGIKNAVSFRGSLYYFKDHSVYQTDDLGTGSSGLNATFWSILDVDKGAGTEVFGIGQINSVKGAAVDKLLVADHEGLLFFNGVVQRPELSWKVSQYFQRKANIARHDEVQVVNDAEDRYIYVTVPASDTLTILMAGDYNLGTTVQNIKWTFWEMPWRASCLLVRDVDNKSQLLIGSLDGGIYEIQGTNPFSDQNAAGALVPIETRYVSHLAGASTGVNHFENVLLNVQGVGNLRTRGILKAGLLGNALSDTPLTNPQTRDVTKAFLQVAERCGLQLITDQLDENFYLDSITMHTKPLYAGRPVVG